MAKRADFNQIASRFGISPYLARIIRNRDAVTDEEIAMFLDGDVSDMHDPRLLKDLESAAQILADAIDSGANIRIVGDYDIDGVCASYILKKGIMSAGGIADVRLPERIRDGYGINADIIRKASDDGIELIITCDNGIAAAEETELALSLGMSVIVTDHHEVPFEEENGKKNYKIPCADAVVDPKRPDCGYPFKGICGAMVAYKLISYLYKNTEIGEAVEDKDGLLTEFLSFAAFATVGDVMELKDENRTAVRAGLEILKNTGNVGMSALIEATGIDTSKLSAFHIGFILGPCINASGRLETADAALELLFCTDRQDALEKARALVAINEERKSMTAQFTKRAEDMVEEMYSGDRVLVVYMPDCHESLPGIVAGKLRERFYKPAIVLCDDAEGNIKGSGRSIETYPMYDELNKVKDLFTKFGGHKMAAGLSMPAGFADELRRRLNDACTLTADDLTEKLSIDIPMPIGYVDEALINELARLEPHGMGNPRPLFAQKDIPVRSMSLMGNNKKVLKMVLEGRTAQGEIRPVDAILFDDAEAAYAGLRECRSVSIVYQPGFNEYNGRRGIQLVVKDYMPGS